MLRTPAPTKTALNRQNPPVDKRLLKRGSTIDWFISPKRSEPIYGRTPFYAPEDCFRDLLQEIPPCPRLEWRIAPPRVSILSVNHIVPHDNVVWFFSGKAASFHFEAPAFPIPPLLLPWRVHSVKGPQNGTPLLAR
jgi:hypothetical protein